MQPVVVGAHGPASILELIVLAAAIEVAQALEEDEDVLPAHKRCHDERAGGSAGAGGGGRRGRVTVIGRAEGVRDVGAPTWCSIGPCEPTSLLMMAFPASATHSPATILGMVVFALAAVHDASL